MSQFRSSSSDESFEVIETPADASSRGQNGDCGVRTTSVSELQYLLFQPIHIPSLMFSYVLKTNNVQYTAIKNAPLPADAAGNDSFSLRLLAYYLVSVPLYATWQIGGGIFTWIFVAILTTVPVLMIFWVLASSLSPRKNEKARFPGLPVEHYLHFRSEADRMKYRGKAKIPMETFHEMYFNQAVDFKGDALDVMEYRHDWASFRFTMGLFRFFLTGMLPELLMHTRSQGMY